MEKFKSILLVAILLIASTFATTAQKEVKKSFAAKKMIKISMVSGDCILKKADANQFNIILNYTYSDDCFKYRFKENDDYLEIKEEFDGNCNGESKWEISVPESTEVVFNSASGNLKAGGTKNGFSANTASGDLEIDGVGGTMVINTASGNVFLGHADGDLKLNTASGDVTIRTLTGNLEMVTASGNANLDMISGKCKCTSASGDILLNAANKEFSVTAASGNATIKNSKGNGTIKTASGDISISNSSGAYEMKTASGSINAESIEMTGKSELITASGNVYIQLSKAATFDLAVTSASGDAEVDYNGNELSGYFEFSARKDKGKIISPVKFDKEEVVEIDEKDYDKKSFTKGSQSPQIILKTSSGTVRLSK